MKQKLIYIAFILTLIGAVQLAQGLNYFYFSDHECTPTGEYVRFWSGDTLWGPVRTNDTISIMGNPVFYDVVISCARDIYYGPGYHPTFLGPDPYLNAPRIAFPYYAGLQRESAIEQGHYFDVYFPTKARVILEDHNLHITWGILGTPFDTLDVEDHPLPDSAIVYFNCPIWLSGTCHTTLILCAAGNISLEAEESIVVLNTVENGRENSGGVGLDQTDQDSTSIVINAYLVALGSSFTFEQQNDMWDSYVFEGSPDDRGEIHLYGGTAFRYRGYVHRSNNGGTGYLKDYHWDERMRNWNIGIFPPGPGIYELVIDPPELDFGEVAVGSSVWDTVYVHAGAGSSFSGVTTTFGFYSPAGYSYGEMLIPIPVRFTPTQFRDYDGNAYFFLNGAYYSIPLRGVGIHPPASQSFAASAYPNPFNSATSLSLNLPTAGDLQVILYDILGREVERLSFDHLPAGSQLVRLDMSHLASGVYYASMQAGGSIHTVKLLLMK
jgi:hypothetical protein